MTNGKSYRVGIVGAGYVSEFHIKALQRLPNVRIVGITDLNRARARATAHRYGITPHPSLKVMAAEGLDVVHVLTPPDSHVDVAIEALSLGCHVLVEKPLATSVEDCDLLIAESQARNLRVCTNHSLLGDPLIKRALELVKTGVIGNGSHRRLPAQFELPAISWRSPPPTVSRGWLPVSRSRRARAVLAARVSWEHPGCSGRLSHVRLERQRSEHPFRRVARLGALRQGHGQRSALVEREAAPASTDHQGTRGTLRADLFAMYLTRRGPPRLCQRPRNVWPTRWQNPFHPRRS